MREVASHQNELIRLTDRPGTDDAPGHEGRTGGRSVRVRVLGRHAPGSLLGHDWLDCEITVTADGVRGHFVALVTERQLRRWEVALDRLDRHEAVRWLDEEHGPELRIEPGRPGGVWVTVSDAEESGVTLRVVLSPASGWPDEQRALLKRVRDAYPSEVVEVAPGVHAWRGQQDSRTPTADG
ncbi:hypothetical protein P3T27_003261 [Kitasatospora sp. MAA19]|uniref:DUF5959 family protein n=1 Tax=Kitasatospora sp. MAA19 TaxID=3035090 RepID=UPI0024751E58|nr:DUF5959 family protein [Kitasatospora sp. MAA19]MDH6706534.1 hypothetical protein [Kitasatospora sp. MAA19]